MITLTCDCCGREIESRVTGPTTVLIGGGIEQHFCDMLCLKVSQFEHTAEDAEKIAARKEAA